MECKNCESNFRTIHIPDDKDRICYKCGFNNGKKINDEKEIEGQTKWQKKHNQITHTRQPSLFW